MAKASKASASEGELAAAPGQQTAPKSAKPRAKPSPKRKPKPQHLPQYNVVLLDDDDHTYEYVVEMLHALFGHPAELALKMAREVDKTGRVIVYTAHRELAELKRDQIHSWGADWRVKACKGSMRATIEPACNA